MAQARSEVQRAQCLAPGRHIDAPLDGAAARYGRLFGELDALADDETRLLALCGPGGVCDGGAGYVTAHRTEAGWPFFGQLIAHDITADRSPLMHGARADQLVNSRTPRADLECLYGAGLVGNPFLYQRDDPAKLLVDGNHAGEPGDVPRNAEGIALIGDPRNDSHLFVSQLHLAMLRLHNLAVDHLRGKGVPKGSIFDEGRRILSWIYQWVIVNDYLPRLAGRALVDMLVPLHA